MRGRHLLPLQPPKIPQICTLTKTSRISFIKRASLGHRKSDPADTDMVAEDMDSPSDQPQYWGKGGSDFLVSN